MNFSVGGGGGILTFEMFLLHFWSRNFIIIEDVKSDLRFQIDQAFRNNQIEIPFPQRDIWIKNASTNNNIPIDTPTP